MFTYIKLKNFLSFGDVEFNFKKNSTTTKKFVAIYGENGSGKSNFVRSIELLCKTLISFNYASKVEKLSDIIANSDDYPPDTIKKFIEDHDILNYFSSCRMIDCEEPTEIEYGFLLDGYEGKYKLSFSDGITEESLYYLKNKERGYLFRISSDENGNIKKDIWSELFLSNEEKKETETDIDKYWGKHTLLAIISNKIIERNEAYIRKNISKRLLDVIDMFLNTTIIVKGNDIGSGFVNSKPIALLNNLEHGKISKNNSNQLEHTERMLREFLTQSYADIKDVSYYTEATDNDMIKYRLYVDKMIAGKVRRIDFQNESSGTKRILTLVRRLLGLFYGLTVVIDEADTGIHDILFNNIISSLSDDITGQLIITTHNTILLEEIKPDNVYVIQVDYQGNKQIRSLEEFSIKKNNNIRKQYLQGLFGGIPYVDGIDYTSIIDEIEGGEEDL